MGQVVLCARIARTLTAVYYDSGYEYKERPALAARQAAALLPSDYPGMLRFALHSLAVYLDLGYSSHRWLAEVLEAAHFSSSFRRCFFFAYKENRCLYPRVTNRGVQVQSKGRKSVIRKG